MSATNENLSHVRDILKKLDRSIDDARAKRLETDPEPGDRDESAAGPEQESSSEEPEGREGRARPKRARPMNGAGGGIRRVG